VFFLLLLLTVISDNVGDRGYSDVVHSEEFLNLPVDQVTKLIADDQLAVSTEEQVNCCFSLYNQRDLSDIDVIYFKKFDLM